jgi:hypothetical protein
MLQINQLTAKFQSAKADFAVAGCVLALYIRAIGAGVAEWQTRQTQNLLPVREWGFKSLHPHQQINSLEGDGESTQSSCSVCGRSVPNVSLDLVLRASGAALVFSGLAIDSSPMGACDDSRGRALRKLAPSRHPHQAQRILSRTPVPRLCDPRACRASSISTGSIRPPSGAPDGRARSSGKNRAGLVGSVESWLPSPNRGRVLEFRRAPCTFEALAPCSAPSRAASAPASALRLTCTLFCPSGEGGAGRVPRAAIASPSSQLACCRGPLNSSSASVRPLRLPPRRSLQSSRSRL